MPEPGKYAKQLNAKQIYVGATVAVLWLKCSISNSQVAETNSGSTTLSLHTPDIEISGRFKDPVIANCVTNKSAIN